MTPVSGVTAATWAAGGGVTTGCWAAAAPAASADQNRQTSPAVRTAPLP